MQINQLTSFIRVVEYQSITKAAESLFISAPALKQKIDSLEKEVGVPLLHRSPMGVFPTASGEYFLKGSKKITELLHDIVQETRNMDDDENKTVNVGYRHRKVTDYIYQDFLMSFQATYPDVRVKLFDVSHTSYNIIDILVNDYISSAEFEVSHYLCDVPIHCIMNANQDLSVRESLNISDLKNRELIILPQPVIKSLQPSLLKSLQEENFEYVESGLERKEIYLDMQTSNKILISFGYEKHLPNNMSQVLLNDYTIQHRMFSRKNFHKTAVKNYLNHMKEFYNQNSKYMYAIGNSNS